MGFDHDEQDRLAVLAKAGDQSSASGLWESVRKLGYFHSRKFFHRNEDLQDVQSEIGLVFTESLQSFDPLKGLRFHVWFCMRLEWRFKNRKHPRNRSGQRLRHPAVSLDDPSKRYFYEARQVIEDDEDGTDEKNLGELVVRLKFLRPELVSTIDQILSGNTEGGQHEKKGRSIRVRTLLKSLASGEMDRIIDLRRSGKSISSISDIMGVSFKYINSRLPTNGET